MKGINVWQILTTALATVLGIYLAKSVFKLNV